MNGNDPMMEAGFHPWLAELGAYVVGALEPDEEQALRRHLAACPVCQAECRELESAAGLLAAVPAEAFEPDAARHRATADGVAHAPAPDPEMWERLRARAGLTDRPAAQTSGAEAAPRSPAAAASQGSNPSRTRPATAPPAARARRPKRSRWPSRPGASAALSGTLVALASVGVFVGVQATSGPSVAAAETVSAANASTGVSGTVRYRPTDWGSWVQVTLKGVPPGDDCVMYAVDGHGSRAVAGSWWAPYSGAQPATIPGGVAMQASTIQQFVVETTNGQILLTVPVP